MVETLVAVAILMISIAGPLTIAQKGLTASIYARDQVIASFLAQDAMEFIKNYRDNNIIAGYNNWLAYLYGSPLSDNVCNSTTKLCTVDTTGDTIPSSVALNTNTPERQILYNDGGGYKTSGTRTSKFSRKYYMTNVTNSEATVVVEVSWSNGTVQNSVVLENQIFRIIR